MQKITGLDTLGKVKRKQRAKLDENANIGCQTVMLSVVLLKKKLWRVSVAPGDRF